MSRCCVVTGAASGIGAATAALLGEHGGTVIGVDLAAAEIAADLATPAGRAWMLAEVRRRLDGRALDCMVACAGVIGRGATTLAVNFFGATATLTGLLPLLQKSDSPRAVAIGSVAAYFPADAGLVELMMRGDEAAALNAAQGQTDTAIYAASKRALTQWCRVQAIGAEWAGSNVLLNVVAPGLVETGLNRETFTDPVRRKAVAAMMPAPLGRHAQPEDVAGLVGYLTSAANSFTTGQVIFCDGGQEALQRGAWPGPAP